MNRSKFQRVAVGVGPAERLSVSVVCLLDVKSNFDFYIISPVDYIITISEVP